MLATDDGNSIVTYKLNLPDFSLFRAKFDHNFEVLINKDNFEFAKCVCLNSGDIAIGNEGVIYFLNGVSYYLIHKIDLELNKSDTREPIIILTMNKSPDDSHIAILVGK